MKFYEVGSVNGVRVIWFVKIPHNETGRLCGGIRMADFIRARISGLAVHRSRAADEPDIRRRWL